MSRRCECRVSLRRVVRPSVAMGGLRATHRGAIWRVSWRRVAWPRAAMRGVRTSGLQVMVIRAGVHVEYGEENVHDQ